MTTMTLTSTEINEINNFVRADFPYGAETVVYKYNDLTIVINAEGEATITRGDTRTNRNDTGILYAPGTK